MGISVGWGDRYGSLLRDQYVDVTNLTSGNYRLSATADLAGQFTEASESNNTTWVDLKLTLNANKKGKGGNKGDNRRVRPAAIANAGRHYFMDATRRRPTWTPSPSSADGPAVQEVSRGGRAVHG